MVDPSIERTERELNAYKGVVQSLRSDRELPQILNHILAEIISALHTQTNGMILLWKPASSRLIPQAWKGYFGEEIRSLQLKAGEGIAGKTFTQGVLHFYTKTSDIEKAKEALSHQNAAIWEAARKRKETPSNYISVPISKGVQKFGVLLLENFDSATEIGSKDLSFIESICNLIALRLDYEWQENQQTGNSSAKERTLYSSFIGEFAHELRMPLTAIKGYATALLLDNVQWSSKKQHEFLQHIEEECDNLDKMLSNLIAASVIEDNQLHIEKQPLDLLKITSEIVYEFQIRSDRHKIIMDFPERLPTIFADAQWIRQILRNLLDNAIKYSPQGGLVVVRCTERIDDILVSVADQGIGIAPEDMPSLFAKYVRIRSGDRTDFPGTGLGLPIVRTVIEAHGGRIWVESQPGEGTTMNFTLPLCDDEELEVKGRKRT